MSKVKVLHLTTHLNVGGITTYIYLLGKAVDRTQCEISVLSSGGGMTHEFQEAGIQTYEFPIKTKSELSPKIYLALPKVIQLIREKKIDLIHAHTRVTQVMAWWIEKLTGIPYVTTCHGFYKRRLGRRLLPAWGSRVIAISTPVEDNLTGLFQVPKNQVQTIFNAIDINSLESRRNNQDVSAIRDQYGIKSDTFVIGLVARIVEDKGHEYLVRAFNDLVRKHKLPAKLLIVGEGPFEYKVRRLVHELDLDSFVVFTGNLTDVTVALSVTNIFVLPAIWREGFGLSIVEAMALKIPVIVTNIWALNALVHDRDNGLLIPPKDIRALAKAIQELMDNRQFAKFIGMNGYETVRKEFAIDRMAQQMVKLYQEVN